MILYVLLVVAGAVMSVPIIAVVLVSIASRLEDSRWTITGHAPGLLQAAARYIVGFHSVGIVWLSPARQGRDQASVSTCHLACRYPQPDRSEPVASAK